MVRKSAMKTHGNHGPSGLDANEWQRLLTSFKSSSADLCKMIAKVAKRIATSHLTFLLPYNSCQLIALGKGPAVRPIGIGEVLRRIIGRTLVKCIKADLNILGGDQQLSMGPKGGIEHAIHSLRSAFKDTDSEAILLIDAKNALNIINHNLALRNIEKLCLSLDHSICNSYREQSILFTNKQTIFSQEGKTQGDPLAMSINGIAIICLIQFLDDCFTVQKW